MCIKVPASCISETWDEMNRGTHLKKGDHVPHMRAIRPQCTLEGVHSRALVKGGDVKSLDVHKICIGYSSLRHPDRLKDQMQLHDLVAYNKRSDRWQVKREYNHPAHFLASWGCHQWL